MNTPEVVDSYLLRDGAVIGRALHEERFAESVGGPAVHDFLSSVRARLPRRGEYFPRVEWYGGEHFALEVRPAPPLRESTVLWWPPVADPRQHPGVKGPDLAALGELRAAAVAAGADDALLISAEGVILEAANAAVVFWPDEHTVVLPRRTVLPSVTVQATRELWAERGIRVVHRDVRELTWPAWCGSALHGWTPVRAWLTPEGEQEAAPAPSVADWNAALWERAD